MALFTEGKLFKKAGEGSGGGGGGDQHNLGWYATQSALEEAHPTAEAGDWAIVGATDTVWIWDTDTSAWKDSDQKGQVTSVNGQTGDVVLDLLPSQTGNAGKFLTTDGTDASWSNKPLVNNSSGSNGLNIGNGTYSTNSTNSVAIGNNAQDGAYSVIIGVDARSFGYGSKSNVAIGYNSYIGGNSNCIAIGDSAKTGANNAIQLNASGSSQTNSDANTVKIANANGNFEIMSADGTIPEARLADTTNAQQGDVLTLDVNGDAVWQAGGSGGGLPSQTGQSGKFLTTDGTDASWATINALQNTATRTGSIGILGTSGGVKSISVGSGATANGNWGIAIGESSSIGNHTRAIAIGASAVVNVNNAIQISVASVGQYNSDANTFKVANTNGNFEIMSANGTIPTARLTKVNSTITLTAAGWSSNTQTVNVTGMTATGVVMVSPDPTDQSAYTSAGVLCTAQATDSLTFTCDTTPSSDIDVVVVQM